MEITTISQVLVLGITTLVVGICLWKYDNK
jgi:hypothetical protein